MVETFELKPGRKKKKNGIRLSDRDFFWTGLRPSPFTSETPVSTFLKSGFFDLGVYPTLFFSPAPNLGYFDRALSHPEPRSKLRFFRLRCFPLYFFRPRQTSTGPFHIGVFLDWALSHQVFSIPSPLTSETLLFFGRNLFQSLPKSDFPALGVYPTLFPSPASKLENLAQALSPRIG